MVKLVPTLPQTITKAKEVKEMEVIKTTGLIVAEEAETIIVLVADQMEESIVRFVISLDMVH